MPQFKCYIIRLTENSHSCKVAQDCYRQAVDFGLQPEFFNAINGSEASIHYEKTGIKRAKKFKKERPGVLGCFFSHYYLWQTCVEINEPVIVLEHDGYFIRKLPADILERFDDVLKLDNCDPYASTYNQDVESSASDDVRVVKYINQKSKKTSTKSFSGSGNYFRGAYSYIIKPQGAQKIIEFIAEHGHLPADQQIGDTVVDTRVVIPTIARLHPFYGIKDNMKQFSLTQDLKSDRI